ISGPPPLLPDSLRTSGISLALMSRTPVLNISLVKCVLGLTPGIAQGHGSLWSWTTSDGGAAEFQRLLWRSRRIDRRPVDRADIVFFLQLGDLGRGVRRVPSAGADTLQSGCKIGVKVETDEPNAQLARGIADRSPFGLVGKYRVDHDRMSLRKNANG